jgi:hypothetical protein
VVEQCTTVLTLENSLGEKLFFPKIGFTVFNYCRLKISLGKPFPEHPFTIQKSATIYREWVTDEIFRCCYLDFNRNRDVRHSAFRQGKNLGGNKHASIFGVALRINFISTSRDQSLFCECLRFIYLTGKRKEVEGWVFRPTHCNHSQQISSFFQLFSNCTCIPQSQHCNRTNSNFSATQFQKKRKL